VDEAPVSGLGWLGSHPDRARHTDDGVSRKRPEVTAIEAVPDLAIHEEDFAVPKQAAALPDGQIATEPIPRQRLAEDDVVVRGLYDVSGLRADADVMIWWHAETADALQDAYNAFRRTAVGARMAPVWSQMALHRPAEFNKSHVPGFLRGEHAREWLTVYPFVRSYEWYLLPEEERRAMLADHGRKGSAFTGVLANTVARFALNDYEWLLGLESDNLLDLVDMMRDLRYTEARRHVREEVPFFTGKRFADADIDAQILEVVR